MGQTWMGLKTSMGGGLMPFAGQTATMSDVSRMSAYHNQLGWV